MSDFAAYDFGLALDDETRARRLLEESVVVDMLFQGPTSALGFTDELTRAAGVSATDALWPRYRRVSAVPAREAAAGRFDAFREHWLGSGVTLGNRQVELDDPYREQDFAVAQLQFDRLGWLDKALTAADVRRAKTEGRAAGLVSTQNSDGIDQRFEVLRTSYEFGLRMIGLTYNMQNPVGTGCTEHVDSGLTHFGVELVRRMDELGIMVDTAHSGRQTTLDACAFSERPVVASHTSASGVFPHQRAKSDEELLAIAGTGGVVGVYGVPFFLTAEGHGTIDLILDHVDYIADLIGWRHVALGTDWPLGVDADTLAETWPRFALQMGFREEHGVGVWNLEGFRDYRDFPNIPRGLVARGYTDEQITGILGENFLRVFEAVCG